MSSLRPLFTITILAVVGAYLYVKINEAPPRHADAGAPDQAQIAADVPPLAPLANTPVTSQYTAPQWPSTTPPAATPPAAVSNEAQPSNPLSNPSAVAGTGAATPATGASPAGIPEMPPIPELPGMPEPPTANNPSTSLTPAPPMNPPIGIPGAPLSESPPSAGTEQSPPSKDLSTGNSLPTATTSAPPETEHASSTDSAIAALGLTQRPGESNVATTPPASVAPTPNALRAPAEVDRYAMPKTDDATSTAASPATPLAAETPSTSAALPAQTFATSWPEIETALNNRQLARAHQLLSPWYGNPTLTPADAQKVEMLLSQLAGTVIYSTEHQLEPAYTVRPGDTLETIAKQYQVPWQLLAKINGVSAADQVRPGQELKVVRGPFSAVVDVSRNQLELLVDGRYAGKFPVTVASNTEVGEGEWVVDQKLTMPSTTSASPVSAVDRTIVLRDAGAATAAPASLGRMLTIASAASPSGPAAATPAIRVSPQDAEEISDILSVGSRVVIRR